MRFEFIHEEKEKIIFDEKKSKKRKKKFNLKKIHFIVAYKLLFPHDLYLHKS
jgi:hypothetical protein